MGTGVFSAVILIYLGSSLPPVDRKILLPNELKSSPVLLLGDKVG